MPASFAIIAAALFVIAAPAQAGSRTGIGEVPSPPIDGGGATSVPAPPVVMLFAAAVAGLAVARRRRGD